jgi:carbon-monoxide dehydrogenase large subunit
VANAVLDALAPLGITHLDLPLTPGRVWAALARVGAETGQPPTPPPSPGGPPRPS